MELLQFLPGFTQGLVRVMISYPFDYIRVYLQKNKYQSARQLMCDPYFKFRHLYRGLKYPLSIIPLDRAISFKLYEDLNQRKYNPLLSSFLVSLVTCSYNVPLQSINTNYILSNQQQGYFTFIKRMFQQYQSGFFYRSYLVEYSRLVMGSTLYMGIYGNLRQRTPDQPLYHMTNGILTNLISWSILYPLDTIRVEHQTSSGKLREIIHQKWRTQGFKSFYRGIPLVYLRTVPSAAMGMLAYEWVRKKISS
jgi:hypothetical protein